MRLILSSKIRELTDNANPVHQVYYSTVVLPVVPITTMFWFHLLRHFVIELGCIFHSVCRVGRCLTSPSTDIMKLLHSILRSFAIRKTSTIMIQQLNLGSEQHTTGCLFVFPVLFEVVVCVFFLSRHHVFRLLSSA